jgi:deazaflavin-dependent oxidoreductase (nitroreductase family)
VGQVPEDPKAYNEQLITKIRQDGFDPERPMLLLTTTGARSGQEHVTPVMFIPHGDDVLLVASNNGAASDPDWLRNLRADPKVGIEMYGGDFTGRAEVPGAAERDALFAGIVERYPFFAEHQERAGDRVIPVVVVHRS